MRPNTMSRLMSESCISIHQVNFRRNKGHIKGTRRPKGGRYEHEYKETEKFVLNSGNSD